MRKLKRTTVGKYLIKRLEEVGVRHIFGVPGDYVLGFFKLLEKSSISVVCNCNELNAGYAADAYARINGVSAVCVTYGVGGLSLFNAVCGSFAERLPVIAISGAPKISEKRHHHLLHHTIGDMDLQFKIYEKVTEAAVTLVNPEQAPKQIDEIISTCLRSRRPVYIEIPVDIVSAPCRAGAPLGIDASIPSDEKALREAVCESISLLKVAKRPVILAGVEAHRLGIRKNLKDLIEKTGYPFATTQLGKSVVPEEHPQFIGVYGGVTSWPSARPIAERADVFLSLGALMTDMELGKRTTLLDPSRMITANSDSVRIKNHIYNNVSLKDFIDGLRSGLRRKRRRRIRINYPYGDPKKRFLPSENAKLTLMRFYKRINRFIDKNNIIIAGTGDSIFCGSNLLLPKGVEFIAQAFYLSIGFSVPATLGIKLAAPGKRPITFVGDGAFQMTAQEVSTIIRLGLNPIIFLSNNAGYLIERVMVDGKFNDLQNWKYYRLPEVFGGGWGCKVTTEDELEYALRRAKENPNSFALIELKFDKWDCSDNLRTLGKQFKSR